MAITAEERAARTARSSEVSEIIRSQIGHQALFMMGAKNFVCGCEVSFKADESGVYADTVAKAHYLQFNVMKNRVGELVRILLDEGTDTYRVVIMRVRSLEVSIKADKSGVYAEDLAATVGRMTGLAIKL
jgi:hypothetical protein